MQHAFTQCLLYSLSLAHCHYTMYENNAHIGKCGSDELQTKGYGDHFSKGEGGHVGMRRLGLLHNNGCKLTKQIFEAEVLDAEQMTCLVLTV